MLGVCEYARLFPEIMRKPPPYENVWIREPLLLFPSNWRKLLWDRDNEKVLDGMDVFLNALPFRNYCKNYILHSFPGGGGGGEGALEKCAITDP